MKNKSVYITVRLDVEYKNYLNWEEVKEEIVNNCRYHFEYDVADLSSDSNKFESLSITDTEICGESETI